MDKVRVAISRHLALSADLRVSPKKHKGSQGPSQPFLEMTIGGKEQGIYRSTKSLSPVLSYPYTMWSVDDLQ